jgi:hypothetical protein
MVQGRKPDQARRAEMILLRAEGLTFAEIGRRMGVTRQSVQLTLKAAGKAALMPPVQCRQCARRVSVRRISFSVAMYEAMASNHGNPNPSAFVSLTV